MHFGLPLGWEAEQLGDGVQGPPYHFLLGGPGPITLPYLIQGYGLFLVRFHLPIGAEHLVDLQE